VNCHQRQPVPFLLDYNIAAAAAAETCACNQEVSDAHGKHACMCKAVTAHWKLCNPKVVCTVRHSSPSAGHGSPCCAILCVFWNHPSTHLHPLPGKVDAQCWLWYLRGDLLCWQVYRPRAIWQAIQAKVLTLWITLRVKLVYLQARTAGARCLGDGRVCSAVLPQAAVSST
jgi:hypothetical protein